MPPLPRLPPLLQSFPARREREGGREGGRGGGEGDYSKFIEIQTPDRMVSPRFVLLSFPPMINHQSSINDQQIHRRSFHLASRVPAPNSQVSGPDSPLLIVGVVAFLRTQDPRNPDDVKCSFSLSLLLPQGLRLAACG